MAILVYTHIMLICMADTLGLARMFGALSIQEGRPSGQRIVHGLARQLGIGIRVHNNRRTEMLSFDTKIALFISILMLFVRPIYAAQTHSACDGINREITSKSKVTLTSAIAKQLHVRTVEILESFKIDRWSIYYVNPIQADSVYVFYAGNPINEHYVTLWGGYAFSDEKYKIKSWVIKNAPGIPMQLARCFAWRVTKSHFRDLKTPLSDSR